MDWKDFSKLFLKSMVVCFLSLLGCAMSSSSEPLSFLFLLTVLVSGLISLWAALGTIIRLIIPYSIELKDDDFDYDYQEYNTHEELPITGDHFTPNQSGFCVNSGSQACSYCARRIGKNGNYSMGYHCWK